MIHLSPHRLYRSYLKHLRYLPDPHVWRTHQPYFRSLVDRSSGSSSSSNTSRRIERDVSAVIAGPGGSSDNPRLLRGINRARKELNKLRAAVACHPHALRRLLEESYGQRGHIRWELINNIVKSAKSDQSSPIPNSVHIGYIRTEPSSNNVESLPPASSSSTTRPSRGGQVKKEISENESKPQSLNPTSTEISRHPELPSPLIPLRPAQQVPTILSPESNRLRPNPDTAIRKATHRAWIRDWREVGAPIILPPNKAGWATGWENLGVVEGLRILAGLELPKTSTGTQISNELIYPPRPQPRRLPLYNHLPPHIRLLIPRRPLSPPSRDPDFTYLTPRPGETRPNPRTWGPPRLLRPRLIRRAYARLWESLRWVGVRGEEEVWIEGKWDHLD